MGNLEIKPYANNAKKHDKKQIDALAKVVKQIGWRQPVVVNQKGIIVVGHGRWMTYQAHRDELKEIWVIDDKGQTVMGEPEKTPLTDEEESMWRLADNKLNESPWDMELVIEELTLLSPESIDLTGFGKTTLEESPKESLEFESKFEVVVEAKDEQQQREIYNSLIEQGFVCRILTL